MKKDSQNLFLSFADTMSGDVLVDLFKCCVAPEATTQMRPRIDRSMIGDPMNFRHTVHIGASDMAEGMDSLEPSASPPRRLSSPPTSSFQATKPDFRLLTLQLNSKGDGRDSKGNQLAVQPPAHVPHIVNARSLDEFRRH